MTRHEAEVAIARAELNKARLRSEHLDWAAAECEALAEEGAASAAVCRQARLDANLADLDVDIAEARLALAEGAG